MTEERKRKKKPERHDGGRKTYGWQPPFLFWPSFNNLSSDN